MAGGDGVHVHQIREEIYKGATVLIHEVVRQDIEDVVSGVFPLAKLQITLQIIQVQDHTDLALHAARKKG